MRIDSISLYHVALPRKKPQLVAGRMCDSLETVLVKLSSEGISGWGEAAPGNSPTENGEWAAGAFAVLRDWLAPAVLGSSQEEVTIDSGETLATRLEAFRGNHYACAALDAAWWDLKARQQGVPLQRLLGAERSTVEVGLTLDRHDDADSFMAALGAAIDAGYARTRLMIRPGWAVEMLRAVRHEFPEATLYADCDAALSFDHSEVLSRFDDFMLAALEQPLAADDLVGHAMLQQSMRTPICLKQSIASPFQAEMVIDLKSCRKLNLHAGRVGGLTAAVKIIEACKEGEIVCFGGARPQSAIGTRIDLALACRTGGDDAADFFDSGELAVDLAEPLVPSHLIDGGCMSLSATDLPGIGIEPDADVLRKHSIATVVVTR